MQLEDAASRLRPWAASTISGEDASAARDLLRDVAAARRDGSVIRTQAPASPELERLAAVGIRTVEQLARADITDRALVEAVTRSRCFNEGATTLINWKNEAIAFLERKFSGRGDGYISGGLLLNTARLAALREEYAREREQAVAATV